MKKTWMLVLGALLLTAVAASALAQTTGIALDDGIYVFPGGEGSYEADGRTFIIEENTVTVREAGKEDLVLSLETGAEGVEIVTGPALPVEETVFFAYDENVEGVARTECVVEAVEGAACAESAAEDWSEYARFGLSHDAREDALYYQGRRVRIFEDEYALGDQGNARREHIDAAGEIDVRALRDAARQVNNADGYGNPGGTIVGLEVLSDAEFAARKLEDWTVREQEASCVAMEGERAFDPEEMKAFYAPYEAFGLRYDVEKNALYYGERRVRDFVDVRQSNGESMGNGHFKGVMTHLYDEDGEVDVETIRDKSRPDADGDGKLVGLRVAEIR